MSRFSVDRLDLSRFPPPLAIRGIDYDVILAERRTRLVSLFQAAGIPYDVESLETDSANILQETGAFRELLAYAAINDAVRSVLVAFAQASDLDHLGLFYGLQRRTIVEASEATPALREDDAEFRRRVLLAPEAFAAAGPAGAYVFHALNADPRVLNVDVWTPGPGRVSVAIQARDGDGVAPADLVAKVRAHLHRDDIKPLTDVVEVLSIVNVQYAIDVVGLVPAGPDPSAVGEAMVASLSAMAAQRRLPGRDVPLTAVIAAASIAAVDRVRVNLPPADIVVGKGELPLCQTISVTMERQDG